MVFYNDKTADAFHYTESSGEQRVITELFYNGHKIFGVEPPGPMEGYLFSSDGYALLSSDGYVLKALDQ